MLSLPHALFGAALSSFLPPPLSLPLSLTSHFVLDYFPHWNPHINQELKQYGRLTPPTFWLITVDFTVTVIIIYMLYVISRSPVLPLCALLAILPDLVEFPHFFLNYRHPLTSEIIKYQKSHQWHISDMWLGLLTQLIFSFVLLSFFLVRQFSF